MLRDLGKEPVPATELDDAKTYITGAFPLEIETADGIASKVLEALKYGFGREFLESYNDKISSRHRRRRPALRQRAHPPRPHGRRAGGQRLGLHRRAQEAVPATSR